MGTMSSVKFNEGLKSIGKNAFEGCNLSEITLPSTIASIGNYAFASNNLKSVIIPAAVTEIGYGAFTRNDELKTIIIKRANSDGMTLGSNWAGNATVVYDPS